MEDKKETSKEKKDVWPGITATREFVILVNLVHSEVRTQPFHFMPSNPMVLVGSVKPEKEMLPCFWELKSLPSHVFQRMSHHLNPRDLVEWGF